MKFSHRLIVPLVLSLCPPPKKKKKKKKNLYPNPSSLILPAPLLLSHSSSFSYYLILLQALFTFEEHSFCAITTLSHWQTAYILNRSSSVKNVQALHIRLSA